VWQHDFGDFAQAQAAITSGVTGTTLNSPHQTLGFRSSLQSCAPQPDSWPDSGGTAVFENEGKSNVHGFTSVCASNRTQFLVKLVLTG
jgi:hypothetical protein